MPPKAGPSKGKGLIPESSQAPKCKIANDIRAITRLQDEAALLQALSGLRNQLTVKHNERIEVTDERVLLIQSWLGGAPGGKDLFDIWEQCKPRQHALIAVVISLFSNILILLSSHYTYHPLATPIVDALLSQTWMNKININLTSSHNDLILFSMKLLNALASFAGGRERRALLDVFAWESKPLAKLLYMKRRGKHKDDSSNILSSPDIRTLYILFLLSFVDQGTPSNVKSAFLEQRRDTFAGLFKGLQQDPYPVIQRVLETFWNGIWSDPKVKRTLKVGLFNEGSITQIVKLYDRRDPEDSESEDIPADLAHHFLLAICTRPGVGVCFKDRGWYPREVLDDGVPIVGYQEDDDVDSKSKAGKIYNRILSNVLKSLKVNEDSRQQELALRILRACPELVAGYWSGSGLTLEPRLSSKWIANISFFGSVISQPVPQSSFLLSSQSAAVPTTSSSPGASEQYSPSPPPFSTVIENIVPSVSGGTGAIKLHFSKGLQSSSALVQHCTALALIKCLTKFNEVLRIFKSIGDALEEDEVDEYVGGTGSGGRWGRRRWEVEREIRRRVPDVQVIIAFAQQKAQLNANAAKTALLQECGQRLLWLYHQCLPRLVTEARFDVGKLLHSIQVSTVDDDGDDGAEKQMSGLERLRQLHVLRLLKSSDQYSWVGKAGGSRTNLHILFTLYSTTPSSSIRIAIRSLLQSSLGTSVLFQHDPEELGLWLDSLPCHIQDSPVDDFKDDAGSGLIGFLDECAQRCFKTPYKYIEDLQQLQGKPPTFSENQDVDMVTSTGTTVEVDESSLLLTHPETYPSPLLVTLLSQLPHKVNRLQDQTQDDLIKEILPIVSFIQQLIWKLTSKVERLGILWACFGMVEDCFRNGELSSEVKRIGDGLKTLQNPPVLQENELFDYSPLDGISLWTAANIKLKYPYVKEKVDFLLLLLHASDGAMSDEESRSILVDSVSSASSQAAKALVNIKRALCLLNHRLSSVLHLNSESVEIRDRRRNIVILFSQIIRRSIGVLSSQELKELKEYAFQRTSLKEMCSMSLDNGVREAFSNLLYDAFSTTDDWDMKLLGEQARFWAQTLRDTEAFLHPHKVETAISWIPYMDSNIIIDLLTHFTTSHNAVVDPTLKSVVEALLTSLHTHPADHSISSSTTSSPALIDLFIQLQSILPQSDALESALASAITRSFPPLYDGTLPPLHSSQSTVQELLAYTEPLWTNRLNHLRHINVESFLQKDKWTQSTVQIVSSLIYVQSATRKAVFEQLGGLAGKCGVEGLGRVVLALVDSFENSDDAIAGLLENLVIPFQVFTQALTQPKEQHQPQTLALCAWCTATIIIRAPSLQSRLLRYLTDAVSGIPKTTAPNSHFISVVRRLQKSASQGKELDELVEALVSRGLVCAVVRLTSSTDTGAAVESTGKLDEASYAMFSELGAVVERSAPKLSYLVEPVVTASIQDHLGDWRVMQFVGRLVKVTPLKPVTANRFLQSVIQHPKFYVLTQDLDTGVAHKTRTRDAIIDLVAALFHLHPSNSCQPSHVEPLGPLYGGSLSHSDKTLLSVFRLYESTKCLSIAPLFGGKSSTSGDGTSALDRVLGLDHNRMFKTCLGFPQWRPLLDEDDFDDNDSDLYDPVYVLLLLGSVLADNPPDSALTWVRLFRSNVVCLVIRSLSSCDSGIREMALSILVGLEYCLKDTDMVEKPHVQYILHLLRNLFDPSSVTDSSSPSQPPRLPVYTTLHLSHSLRGVFYPSNFVYPLTSRHLLQRPTFDPSDIPMLFGMFYSSSSEQWKKERGWMMRFLSDGMQGGSEWRVLKRRFTWDLVASRFEVESDRSIRRSILEFLANITCNSSATTSLVLKSALLPWIEIQLQSIKLGEEIAWVKILENVIVIVDPSKLERATNGEWRAMLGRCLLLILSNTGCSTATLFHAVQVLVRLSILPGPTTPKLDELLFQSLSQLIVLERNLRMTSSPNESPSWNPDWDRSKPQLPPHTSRTLWHCIDHDPLWTWGKCVEGLWRVSMASLKKGAVWDALTCRLLLWRGIVGESRTLEGEWARCEVIRNMNEFH